MFLKSPPNLSDRAETLTRQVDKHAGADVEWWRFAELAVRYHDHAEWIGERGKLEDKIRSRARWALGALVANLALVATTIGHGLVERGRTEERAAQQERSFIEYRDTVRREFDRMEQDIRDLRRDLRRLSGADKPDAMSIVRLDGRVLHLAVPDPLDWTSEAVVPVSCGGPCSSSVECRAAFDDCRTCFGGHCSGTLPADPPKDAGVDAPGGTTP